MNDAAVSQKQAGSCAMERSFQTVGVHPYLYQGMMSIVLASGSRELASENTHWRKDICSGESDDQARF